MTEARRTPSIRRPNDGGVIDSVRAGAIAERAGLRPGDRIIAIDGRILRDAVDVQYYAAEEEIAVEAVRGDETLLITVQKHPDADLGIEFQDAAFDGIRTCNNSCFFCFLKGNPRGLRRTLYVKDDDYRLSFLHGNFVTLTNLTEEDWKRLDEQRLSPLNVSVHATDLELRRYLLGNKTAPDICEQLRRLGRIGIQANTQVVLCPGVNDGRALDRTVQDLGSLYPTVQSISIVPVGATMYAEERIERGLHADEAEMSTPEYARGVIEQARPYQRQFRRENGRTLLYLADEYYLTAGVQPPCASHYDGYPQFENGIGMTRSLVDGWRRLRTRQFAGVVVREGLQRISLVCGTLIAPTLERIATELADLAAIEVRVHAVSNRFFGSRVNVSGLLAGQDLAQQLAGRDLGDLCILPRYALDYTGGRFLDETVPRQLQQSLDVPLAFASTMRDVLQILTQPVESHLPGATVAGSTNGKAWVDYANIS